eukprot:COSAG05_NODE_2229_length_3362_cov_6.708857_2_plen_127_part_00
MAKFDKMYHDFFGIKPQLNEADLVNKISDYRGGFLYKLIDPATAGNVKADIQAFLNKKAMHVIKTKFQDENGKGFFYVRLGEDPAKESQRIQGFISQLPEVEKFSFTLKPIQKQVTKQTPNIWIKN